MVFNGEFTPGNQWVSPQHPYYQKAFPVRPRDVEKAKALLKEAGVTPPVTRRLHGAEGRGERSGRAGHPVDGGGSRLRHEDPRHRVRHLAQAGARPANFQVYQINWSGRIDPDGNSYVFLHTGAPQNDGGYSNPEADKAMEDARLITDPAAAQGDLREADQDRAQRRADHLSLSPQDR